jgi:hypothetical protein
MSPETWGPPTWTLFHTLAEKIHEDTFQILGPQLFYHIKKICANLPCPECSQHASTFLAKINFNGIKSKTDFKNMLCFFHNTVNYRKKKPVFDVTGLEKYKEYNVINVYNKFVSVYHTKGNMKLIADSFQRKLVLVDFKKWLMQNIQSFL